MVQESNNQPEGVKKPESAPKPETQELITERVDERQEKPLPEQSIEPAATLSPSSQPVSNAGKVATSVLPPEPDRAAIESILSDGLGELYRGLPTQVQEKFRVQGEQVSSKIQEMITHAKITARKVAALIRSWLRLIPGVSHFFLEQEAKIKTDRVMEYSEKR